MVSEVFAGAGAAAGLYVYTYQINHFSASSEEKSGGISFEFGTNPTLSSAGGITSFFIGTSPTSFSSFVTGTVGPTSATWFSTGGGLEFIGSGWVPKGSSSFVFGTFSPLLPTTVIADVLDNGATISSASVYAPVPEPATLLLLGSGLMSMGWFGRKRIKKDPEA